LFTVYGLRYVFGLLFTVYGMFSVYCLLFTVCFLVFGLLFTVVEFSPSENFFIIGALRCARAWCVVYGLI